MNTPSYVVDTNGTKYVLGRALGTGGQGTVFEVEGGRFAVKLLATQPKIDSRRVERQFMFLKHLSLNDLPIAKPVSVLRPPHAGYVMPLLGGMAPMAQLVLPPRGCRSMRTWYREGGCIKRRLDCLASAGETVAGLHAMGLCYGDISPANIFIPPPTADTESWLIDSDNLRHESGAVTQQFCTPGYGAPEVVSRTGTTSSLSDAHSLAVLVFLALAQCHPLIGDLVHDGEPELEERAFAGELPWVDHPTDSTNRSSRGIPRSVVFSTGLGELARRAFTGGLLDRAQRPSAGEWAEGLRRAAAHCLVCRDCRGSYYRNSEHCSWCGKPREAFVYAKARTQLANSKEFLKGPADSERVEDSFVISDGDSAILRAATAFGLSASNRRASVARLKSDRKVLVLERVSEEAYIEIRDGTRRGSLGTDPLQITVDAGLSKWSLHFGPETSNHRVVDFTYYAGGRA